MSASFSTAQLVEMIASSGLSCESPLHPTDSCRGRGYLKFTLPCLNERREFCSKAGELQYKLSPVDNPSLIPTNTPSGFFERNIEQTRIGRRWGIIVGEYGRLDLGIQRRRASWPRPLTMASENGKVNSDRCVSEAVNGCEGVAALEAQKYGLKMSPNHPIDRTRA